MAIEYKSLTKEERQLSIAQNIHSREVEHFHYDLNKTNYESLLATKEMTDLPKEWPDELKPYEKLTRDQAVVIVTDPEQLVTVQALQLRDKLKFAAVAETIERDRVEKYHAQLVAQIPDPTELDAALAAAKAKRDLEASK